MLVDKALRQPLLGWGGWGRNLISDDQGNERSVTDGAWIVALGKNGLIGLGGMLGAYLLPVWVFARRQRRAPGRPPDVILASFILMSLCWLTALSKMQICITDKTRPCRSHLCI